MAYKKSKTSNSKLRGETFFNLAVARGGSYLVSTVSAEGRAKQLQESVSEFIEQFGANELQYFLEEMEIWLAVRGYDACVAAVAYFREHGAPPPAPVATPKAGRAKLKQPPPSQLTSRSATVRKTPGDEARLKSDYVAAA
jgi:hypothetical protein